MALTALVVGELRPRRRHVLGSRPQDAFQGGAGDDESTVTPQSPVDEGFFGAFVGRRFPGADVQTADDLECDVVVGFGWALRFRKRLGRGVVVGKL